MRDALLDLLGELLLTHAPTGAEAEIDALIARRLHAAGLASRGVRIGDRAVPGRRRKTAMPLGPDAICGYALDDKAGVAILLPLLERLLAQPRRHDAILAFTACEESGCSGALHLAHRHAIDDFIAVETAPIAAGVWPAGIWV